MRSSHLMAAAGKVEGGHVVEVVGTGLQNQDLAFLDQPHHRPALVHLDLPGPEVQDRDWQRYRGGRQRPTGAGG